MSRRLPPLNALRAFEAAARHLSFTKAANELHVTQAAISHQVKSLEDTLGVHLFRRLNRRLQLTDAGRDYLPPLRDAFDAIDLATRRLQAREESGALKITVLPSFAATWLLPRLGKFRTHHPDIDVLVTASDALVDFELEDFDIGIRYGPGHYPELRADALMKDEIFPVCAPRLLEGPEGLKRPEDLHRLTLLRDMNRGSDPGWQMWFQAAGVKDARTSRGPGFSHSNLMLSAAVAGEGVALCRRSLVAEDMKAGRLVCPFGPVIPTPDVYSMVTPVHKAELPKVAAFRAWLIAEVESFLEFQPTIHGTG